MSIVSAVGSPSAFSAASGGKIYAYNNISEAGTRVVAPSNPSRRKVLFHNPGVQNLFIAPSNVQNVVGTVPTQPSDHPLAPSNAALGGCQVLYGNGGTLEITGECQGAWQAFAATGAGVSNPLTVVDTNVG